ncbi:phytochelatin synthase family protein [Chamaesiphon sp. OTE_75_metabat_556]|uniref:phytochelatin synthase family protein n=1 Tax=Chamaesiphon sp. OTE_75_metabat_556 TaxID=2964692 RepID=UPI00286AA6AC|nr:phytochelatin synthase family protein [Chamaesiphon sp. OTE_75_metabat_556]
MSADFSRIKLLEFQQPLRCCNITAVAYGLSALGYQTAVDDIFYQIRLPIGSVLDDGMTLSETYDACARYIEVVDLPLVVKVEHFDKPTMTLDAFIKEVEAGVEAEHNIHILNFNTRIAHENPNLEGGHFALLADYDANTQELTVADTNPKRYNRYWKCPVALMYQACVDKDSSSDRSRGMMVLEKTESLLG